MTAEQEIRQPVLLAQWRTVAFVHWPVDPSTVTPLLPDGLVVDEYDGAAWLTVIALRMADVRPPGPFRRPALSFAETNLRTYVRGPGGRDGVWFLHIQAASVVMVAAARLALGAPYRLGDLSVVEQNGHTFYAGSQRDGDTSYRLTVRAGPRLAELSPRDLWLTGRWRAYTRHMGTILETPVHHDPWPLRQAVMEDLHQTLTDAAGLPAPPDEPLIHFSDGVRDVRIGLSRPAR